MQKKQFENEIKFKNVSDISLTHIKFYFNKTFTEVLQTSLHLSGWSIIYNESEKSIEMDLSGGLPITSNSPNEFFCRTILIFHLSFPVVWIKMNFILFHL